MRYIAFFLCLVCATAQARLATKADVSIELVRLHRDITVHKDGTTVEVTTVILKPLKDSGKDSLVSYPIVYNASNSEVKILTAQVVKGDKTYPVEAKDIEDKPLAGSLSAFDQQNQIMIAFSSIDLESEVYLQYQTTLKDPILKGQYSEHFLMGSSFGGLNPFWSNAEVNIRSEIPLVIQVHDKENVVDVSDQTVEGIQSIRFKLNKPYIRMVVEENDVYLNSSFFPWITVSSQSHWSDLGNLLVVPFESELKAPLPDVFQKIATKSKKEKSLVAKMNVITSELAGLISYMGDWRSNKGAYAPRPLQVIANTAIGDCKDFSLSTVAILRSMGYKASVALVQRGELPYPAPTTLPTIRAFNHAIVYVEDKDRHYWIDPTNFASFAQGIFPDIADRESLILRTKGSTLTKTVVLRADESRVQMLKEIDVTSTENGSLSVQAQLSLQGVSTLPITGADLQASKETIDYLIVHTLGSQGRVVKWHVDPYDLSSRIAKPLNFKFSFTEDYSQMKTTAGFGYLLRTPDRVQVILTKLQDRYSDLVLGTPLSKEDRTLISHVKLIGQPLSCSVQSPWFEASRVIQSTSKGIECVDSYQIKQSVVPLGSLQSDEYKSLQEQAYSCFGALVLIYETSQKNQLINQNGAGG